MHITNRDEVKEPPQKKEKKEHMDPFDELRDLNTAAAAATYSSSSSDQRSLISSCEEELSSFKALRLPATPKNPLMFWKDQVAEFPILAEVARRVFCISASSAQSERDFSSVGHTITHVRSRLAPHKVEAIELVKWGWRAGVLRKK